MPRDQHQLKKKTIILIVRVWETWSENVIRSFFVVVRLLEETTTTTKKSVVERIRFPRSQWLSHSDLFSVLKAADISQPWMMSVVVKADTGPEKLTSLAARGGNEQNSNMCSSRLSPTRMDKVEGAKQTGTDPVWRDRTTGHADRCRRIVWSVCSQVRKTGRHPPDVTCLSVSVGHQVCQSKVIHGRDLLLNVCFSLNVLCTNNNT